MNILKSVAIVSTIMLTACGGSIMHVPVLEDGLHTLVGEKAVAKNSTLAVYSCWGGTQSFSNWKPVSGTFGLWPDTVLVVDEGHMFTVDTPKKDGVFESAQLYSTVKDYVDVGMADSTRYYRINVPSLMFVRSSMDKAGGGTTTMLFNCSTDRAKVADPSSIKVIE